MVPVNDVSLWVVIVFALIGMWAAVPKVYRAVQSFWRGVWFLTETRKHKGDMSKSLRMLPRLLRQSYKYNNAAENILPHLVYYFEPGGRTHNLVTKDIEWLEQLASWLKKSSNKDRVQIVFKTEGSDEPKYLRLLRTTMDTNDGRKHIIVIDDSIMECSVILAHVMWEFLTTVKFYCPDIEYVLVENCPEVIEYISTIPTIVENVNGRDYTLFAVTESMVKLVVDTEAIDA